MGGASWTDVIQAIGACASVTLSLVGFLFIIRQIRQVDRSMRGDVCERLYGQNMELLRLFADYPELVPYFYHGIELVEGDPNYNRALIVAEVTASFFELVTLQLKELPPHSRDAWVACIKDSYDSSPFFQKYMEEYKDWYNAEVMKICLGNSLEPS